MLTTSSAVAYNLLIATAAKCGGNLAFQVDGFSATNKNKPCNPDGTYIISSIITMHRKLRRMHLQQLNIISYIQLLLFGQLFIVHKARK